MCATTNTKTIEKTDASTMKKKKDDYVAKMKSQVEKVNAEIDNLEKKSEKASSDIKAEYQDQLKKARAAQKKLQKNMDELGKASEETWENIKDEVEHAWKALTSSANYFKSQFK